MKRKFCRRIVRMKVGREEKWNEELEESHLGTKSYWSSALNKTWSCKKTLHSQCVKDVVRKPESSVCCSLKHKPPRYPPNKRKKGIECCRLRCAEKLT